MNEVSDEDIAILAEEAGIYEPLQPHKDNGPKWMALNDKLQQATDKNSGLDRLWHLLRNGNAAPTEKLRALQSFWTAADTGEKIEQAKPFLKWLVASALLPSTRAKLNLTFGETPFLCADYYDMLVEIAELLIPKPPSSIPNMNGEITKLIDLIPHPLPATVAAMKYMMNVTVDQSASDALPLP